MSGAPSLVPPTLGGNCLAWARLRLDYWTLSVPCIPPCRWPGTGQ